MYILKQPPQCNGEYIKMTGQPKRANCCDQDGECFGDGTDAWCCDNEFYCSSNLQLYAKNQSTKNAVLCNFDERKVISADYTVMVLLAIIVFLIGIIGCLCVYKSNQRKKRRRIANDLAAEEARKKKKVESSSSDSSSSVSSDTVSDSSEDEKVPANANSNKIETEEQRLKREKREEQKRKRLLKLGQMKRKQSVIHDKLELDAGNIELAQLGNYGDKDKEVDKDHDEKIAEALGTEAD